MIGKRKYMILGVLVFILFIFACIIISKLSENRGGFTDKGNNIQGQTLEYEQLEEGSDVEKDVSQDAEESSNDILVSDIDKDDDIGNGNANADGEDEENINYKNEYVEDLGGNEDDNAHKESLQPAKDTNYEYGPIN